MKHLRLILLLAFTLGIASNVEEIQAHTLSLEEALLVAKEQLQNPENAEYFYLESDAETAKWNIFVDLHPGQNWGHECLLVKIPKVGNPPISCEISQLDLFPLGNYKKFPDQMRTPDYDSNKNHNEYSSPDAITSRINLDREKTYAIIISGGGTPYANEVRFWNDCQYIYNTLSKGYDLPKENIFPLISDGDNPADDQVNEGSLVSQNLDFDGDGIPDINLAASKNNIIQVLQQIESQIPSDGHLFIFVIDHGTIINNTACIVLWSNDFLTENEFIDLIRPFSLKGVNLSVLMGQCHSGGFVEAFSKSELKGVIASACSKTESSWGKVGEYDSFVYWWTIGMNELNEDYTPVVSDSDKNGYVSMDEAFVFALNNDPCVKSTEYHETPQYFSDPQKYGKSISLDYSPEETELIIRDFESDWGFEPYRGSNPLWESPDIWIRNNQDGGYNHQNPIYSDTHKKSYAYIKIHNIGRKDYPGGKYVHLNWALASTGLSMSVWKGQEMYPNTNIPTGGYVGIAEIPYIAAGGYETLCIEWNMPGSLIKNVTNQTGADVHFCLLADINDSPDQIEYNHLSDQYTYVAEKNTIAQKNVTIIKGKDPGSSTKSSHLFVRNVLNAITTCSIYVFQDINDNMSIFDVAEVSIKLSPKLTTAWIKGGKQMTGASEKPSDSSTLKSDGKTILFNASGSCVSNIPLSAKQVEPILVNFRFKDSKKCFGETYKVSLVHKLKNGLVIGGETYLIEAPSFYNVGDSIGVIINKTSTGYNLEASVKDEYNHIQWENSLGEVLGTDKSIDVVPTRSQSDFILKVFSSGEVYTKNVKLRSLAKIESLGYNSNILSIRITPYLLDPKSCIAVTDITTGRMITCPIEENSSVYSINIRDFTSQLLNVSLITDGEIIDSQKIQIP